LDRYGSARLNKPSIRIKAAARRTVSNVQKYELMEIPFKLNARKSNENVFFQGNTFKFSSDKNM
jgi:hypothetical protein